MHWKRLGKIFDPRNYKLPNDCVDYAQSPQALVFEDFVRIYFSTRAVDPGNGKHLSHIAFVDMRKDFSEVLRISDKTVIPLGHLGCFDEHGIFPMNVVRRGGDVYGYTCGWSRRVSVSVETAIGLAVSRDQGLTFQRIGDGPILAASLNEPFLVGDGFVKIIGGQFHMWYIFGTRWQRYAQDAAPERTYKIGHAVSEDGITWVKEDGRQIVLDRLGKMESQALPTVIEIDNIYHMFFCYRESLDFRSNPDRAYRIGHAWSADLSTWVREDAEPSLDIEANAWDSQMQCYPNVFECDGKIHMLYNGNQFGRGGFGLAVLER
jgi:hypothetical protein